MLTTRPAWAGFVLSPSWNLWFDASPPATNGMVIGCTRLQVFPKADGVVVSERPEQRRFPAYCLERHIVPNGTFCLGLTIRMINSESDAQAWWADLLYFLVLQAVAEQTRAWPAVHALSHGPEAAQREIEARDQARACGIEDAYNRMIEGEENWLEVCVAGKRIPADIPIATSVLRPIVKLERARREALAAYWQTEFNSGRRCCETMKFCALRDHQARAQFEGHRAG